MNGWLAWFVFVVIGTGVWIGVSYLLDAVSNYYWDKR